MTAKRSNPKSPCGTRGDWGLDRLGTRPHGLPPCYNRVHGPTWGYSSTGRARRSQCRGWGFESPYLHSHLLTPSSRFWSHADYPRFGLDSAARSLRRFASDGKASSRVFSPQEFMIAHFRNPTQFITGRVDR